jgi:hypothetical protein
MLQRRDAEMEGICIQECHRKLDGCFGVERPQTARSEGHDEEGQTSGHNHWRDVRPFWGLLNHLLHNFEKKSSAL